MDLLNKTFARLCDWYRTLTPGARIAAGLLLIVCALSVAFLLNEQVTGGETYLFGGEAVTASQWPTMMQAFATAGLTDYEIEGNRIRVPHGKQAVYMGALANAGALPNNFGDALRKMLDKSSSPWIGKRQQEEMSKVALQDELTKIINSMPGIESASVLYNVQIEQGLTAKKQITASVNVKPSGRQLLSERQVEMIRQVVGPPIGVEPECVAIVDFNGATYPAATVNAGNPSAADRYAKAKQEYEQKYAQKIRETLGSFVSGAVVTVNVELHPEIVGAKTAARVESASAAAATVGAAKSASESNTSSNPTVAEGGGLNQPAIIKTIVETMVGSVSNQQPNHAQQDRALVTEAQQNTPAGLTPKRVTVSIGIPNSYYEQVWRQRNPVSPGARAIPPDGEALRQIETEVCATIKQHVLQVVPWPDDAGPDRAQLVSVTSFQQLAGADEVRDVVAVERAPDWITQHQSTLIAGLIAVGCLLAVRWIVRSPSPARSEASSIRLAGDTLEDFDEDELNRREMAGRLKGPISPSLREELAGIVQDDPDVAASVLRNWIGSSN